MAIRFDDRVALVTGAGSGLGRAYALALSALGAKVAVNDLQESAAVQVAEAIESAGGVAMPYAGSVTDSGRMQEIVQSVRSNWGAIHVLINNAGVLRDRTFAKMTPEEWNAVIDIHLNGAAAVTRAVWPLMREQRYGRILMTSSSSGLYGSFGQSNYAAAKLGLLGFAKSLGLEGAKDNIRVNTIVPAAGTGMTAHVMPPEMFQHFAPERVVPAALYLVSENAPENAVIGAGAGLFHAAYVTMTQGVFFSNAEMTVDDIAARWDEIVDRRFEQVPANGGEQIQAMAQMVTRKS